MDNTFLAEKIRKHFERWNIDDFGSIGEWFLIGVKEYNMALTGCCLEILGERRWNIEYEDEDDLPKAYTTALEYAEFYDVMRGTAFYNVMHDTAYDSEEWNSEEWKSTFRSVFNPFLMSLDEIRDRINDESALSLITEGTNRFIDDITRHEVPLGEDSRASDINSILTEYVNEWVPDFTAFLEKHKDELMTTEGSFITLSGILTALANGEKTEKAFDSLFDFMRNCVDEYGISWEKSDALYAPLRSALLHDNAHAFSALADEAERKGVKVSYEDYPSKSLEILSLIFSSGQLLPGTEEGKTAFYSVISRNPCKEIVRMTYHPSYTLALTKAAMNRSFSPDLYPLIMSPYDDVNEVRDGYLSPIGYAIKSGNRRGVEKLCELGGDPLKTDRDGNSVLHQIFRQGYGEPIDVMAAICFPALCLEFKNDEGKTPLDYLADKLKPEL